MWTFKDAFKAVLKCPLTEAKLSNALLKLIFLTKVHEIWMHDYWSENTSNDIFHFSITVIELEFQRKGTFECKFFITFIRKLTQMLILTLFSRIPGGLCELLKTPLRLFSNAHWLKRNSLMHFWSLFLNQSAWNLDEWLLKWKYI